MLVGEGSRGGVYVDYRHLPDLLSLNLGPPGPRTSPVPRRRHLHGGLPFFLPCLRMDRRSSSVVPPHTPEATLLSRAQARHWTRAGQAAQICFAVSIWRCPGPVLPTGKNRSGSASRQAAASRQLMSTSHWVLGVTPEQENDDRAGKPTGQPATSHFGTPPGQGLPPIRLIISSMAMWYRSVNSETCSKETGSGNSLAALSAACL